MQPNLKPLKQQTIIITGASSGIGLVTAQLAAKRGAQLVLAARNEDELRRIEQQLQSQGARVVAVAADVANRADIERIAETALQHFGGFDTWVNDAGISIWGRLEEVSDEDNRRLFETNFWGLTYGSLAAVRHLKQRGGALINVGSVASDVAFPLQGMYCASKHAIKGFTDALRLELEEEGAPISVTLIKPAAINTPFPQHARNYMAQEPKLPPPVYEPEEVANAILYAAVHPERDIYIGGGGKVMSSFNKHLPRAMDKLSESTIKEQMRDEPPRNPQGALHHAGDDGHVHGDHPGYVMKTSVYTRANRHPVLKNTLMAAATAAATWWLLGKRDNKKATAATTTPASGNPTIVPGSPLTTPRIEDHGIVATHHETVPLSAPITPATPAVS